MAVRDGNRVERLRVLDDGSTSLIEGFLLRPIAQAQAFTKWAFLAALVFLGLDWIPVWGRGFHTLLGVAFFAAIASAVVVKLLRRQDGTYLLTNQGRDELAIAAVLVRLLAGRRHPMP